jgi:hypothetical protein
MEKSSWAFLGHWSWADTVFCRDNREGWAFSGRAKSPFWSPDFFGPAAQVIQFLRCILEKTPLSRRDLRNDEMAVLLPRGLSQSSGEPIQRIAANNGSASSQIYTAGEIVMPGVCVWCLRVCVSACLRVCVSACLRVCVLRLCLCVSNSLLSPPLLRVSVSACRVCVSVRLRVFVACLCLRVCVLRLCLCVFH